MNNIWPLVFFGVTTVYFGAKVLQILPAFFTLLIALAKGVVKWPGPRIYDLDHNTRVIRERLGIRYENLFPTFISNSLGVLGAFVFSLLTFISSTPYLSEHVRINWTCTTVIFSLVVLVGGGIAFKKVRRNMVQVNSLLSDLVGNVEPRVVDAQSARSSYGIEHPLIGVRSLPADRRRALDQFYESVRCHQDGEEFKALALYNEAVRIDPCLHENARESLSRMAQDCSLSDEGAICYWLGIHSEWLRDLRQAAVFYENAVDAFSQIGYKRRASRACNNLGSVKMQMRDPSAMAEFERAIALDPENGMAHISIGVTYYRISERGDSRFEQALDAFANAIIVDPTTYGSLVLSRIRSIGYTWKEDWEDILRRVASKQLAMAVDNDDPAESRDKSKDRQRS